MLGAPDRRIFERRRPDAAARGAGGALLRLVSAISDRVAGLDHGGIELDAGGEAYGDGPVVAVDFARNAFDAPAAGHGAKRQQCVQPARPRLSAAQAKLAIFRRIDAVEPDLDAGDHEAVAVDDARE